MKEIKTTCLLLANCAALLAIILLASCGSSKPIAKDYLYFKDGADTVQVQQKETLIQPNDLLGIQVFSRTLNQEQASIFNLPASAPTIPSSPTVSGYQNIAQPIAQGYQVNAAGNISFPVLGNIAAAGLTKEQLQNLLIRRLGDYVKNPSVIVRLLQFNVNILGEVKLPGTHSFQTSRVTIIDALGAAGDLTDFANRDSIKVIREDSARRITYTVNLKSRTIFESPVYIMQPGDIVYVSPNKYKIKNIALDPEKQRRTSIFISVASIVVALASVIVLATRNN